MSERCECFNWARVVAHHEKCPKHWRSEQVADLRAALAVCVEALRGVAWARSEPVLCWCSCGPSFLPDAKHEDGCNAARAALERARKVTP